MSFRLHRSRLAVGALFIAFCLVWFGTLSMRTLVPTDEGRYAEIAREMAMTGDFITPRLNGIKYFGKPPLQAWITALTFRQFGVGEWQERLWPAICGLLGILMVFHAGRRVYGERVGFTVALVLGASWYWAMAGHTNSYDMSLSAMMTVALGGLLIAQHANALHERRNWMLVCWAGMALAVMSKGLVGIVLPGAVLVLYTLVSRDWLVWKRLHISAGLLLFLAITMPWFVLVSIRNPEFPYFFFVREHFQRFASNVHLRAEPWHYFIPLLLVGVMPWLGVLAQSLRNGVREARNAAPLCGFKANRLLVVWSVFIFVFFSISNAKLPSYILPVFPALALLIAVYLDRASHKAIVVVAAVYGLMGVTELVFLEAVPAGGKFIQNTELFKESVPWAVGAAVIVLVGSTIAVRLARRQREWALVALAAAGLLGGQMLMQAHEPFARYKSGIAHLPAISAELTPDMPIYAVGMYEYVLPVYLGRTMTMVAHAEDGMRLGLQQEPQLWIPDLDAFITKWKEGRANAKPAMAIMRPEMYADFQRRGVPMRVIAQDRLRVIVSNINE